MKDRLITFHPQYKSIEPWLTSLPETFDHTGEVVHKGRNEVRVFALPDGKKVAVKRYKKPMWFQCIDYTWFRPSKAKRAFLYGTRLLEMNIPTPQPVAYIEMYRCGFFSHAYFVSGYSPDSDCNILHDTKDEGMAQKLADFFILMHSNRFLHGDSNISNFLYHKNNADGTDYDIYTIDTNRSTFLDRDPSQSECLDNIMLLTHHLDVLEMVVSKYAERRGWDVKASVDYALAKRTHFEERKKVKKRWKSYLKG